MTEYKNSADRAIEELLIQAGPYRTIGRGMQAKVYVAESNPDFVVKDLTMRLFAINRDRMQNILVQSHRDAMSSLRGLAVPFALLDEPVELPLSKSRLASMLPTPKSVLIETPVVQARTKDVWDMSFQLEAAAIAEDQQGIDELLEQHLTLVNRLVTGKKFIFIDGVFANYIIHPVQGVLLRDIGSITRDRSCLGRNEIVHQTTVASLGQKLRRGRVDREGILRKYGPRLKGILDQQSGLDRPMPLIKAQQMPKCEDIIAGKAW